MVVKLARQYLSVKAKNRVALNAQMLHQNLSKFLTLQMESLGCKLIPWKKCCKILTAIRCRHHSKLQSEVSKKVTLQHVLARISNDRNASNIVKEVDILQVITWEATAWKEVSEMTTNNYFEKCVIV